MRIVHLFAVLLAVAGASAVTPAAAETALTRPASIATPLAQPSGTTATAYQYRDRGRHYGWRNGNRGWHGGYRSGWRRGYYRPRYGYGRPYRWRGSRVVCRTSWRWGRPHRVCFRRW